MSDLHRYNILSLDPMYSPLHSKIGQLIGKDCYALLSCRAKKIYLRGYQCILATDLINSVPATSIPLELLEKIEKIETYHHSYVKKLENRPLKKQELIYMARLYQALESYIVQKEIDLVLVHNDLRWYHAVAIDICKKRGIRYLVTEQGLIRPYTTVIDNRGVNANANIELREKLDTPESSFVPNSKHDSIDSMIYFFMFISLFALERFLGSNTILRYMHNNYSIGKYYNRLWNKLNSSSIANDISDISDFSQRYMLLLLQLENDSQILVHSKFKSNQEIIERVEKQAEKLGVRLFIKKHPLDTSYYQCGDNVNWVSGDVKQLSQYAKLVITVNSSAAIDVLHTPTPMLLLGDSIYNYPNVGVQCDIEDIYDVYQNISIDVDKRKKFINSIEKNYLLRGSGFSYCDGLIRIKLKSLLED